MIGVGDVNISAKVNGTTFVGIYEVVGLYIELTSLDFGERASPMLGDKPEIVAERMLRTMATEAMRNSPHEFRKDDETS